MFQGMSKKEFWQSLRNATFGLVFLYVLTTVFLTFR